MNRIMAFLQQVPLFKAFRQGDLQKIAEVVKVKLIKKGDVLFRKGEQGTALYLIVHGRIKISVTSKLGDEVILSVLSNGELFGDMALLDGMTRSADAVALEDSQLCVLYQNDFIAILMKSSTAIKALFSTLCARLRKTDKFVEETCFLNVSSRLARRLSEFAERQIQAGDTEEIRIEMTQTELASMVGATRESVNKELRSMRERGIVRTEGRSVIVCDLERLKRRARWDEKA
ncbi:MAG: Crp/Fnr family transcriptional regulator [Deltaproteobacteria bacterium]|jgi:CRP-like cAMP-binding protein|nr:Crp/Fnr family transcriptional regulator [Deltaproteobacteria bacterium]